VVYQFINTDLTPVESIFNENDPNLNKQTGEREPDPATLAQLKGGANWFYWIAGLSLVNSAIFAFGGQVSFISGLAFTQIIDAIADAAAAQGAVSSVRAVAVVIDLMVMALFGLIGYYANKAINAVFIGGMIIYIVDALLWLWLESLFAFGFHVFALIMIFRGFLASREVNRIIQDNAALRI
jgi:hypothetical protein